MVAVGVGGVGGVDGVGGGGGGVCCGCCAFSSSFILPKHIDDVGGIMLSREVWGGSFLG